MRAGRKYHAKATVKPNKEGWDYSVVTIFDGAAEIGSYERNFPRFGEETFEPFEIDGAWYALYSCYYTCTRVMSLPACRDLGGEEPCAHGFCPVELYVPRYKSVVTINKNGEQSESWKFEDEGEKYDGDKTDSFGNPITVGSWQSLGIGFVAGCLWGDDSSWKLEVFDLSRAAEGILSRSARFGHLQLADKFSLAKAVRLHRYPPTSLRANILQQQEWDVTSGAPIDPYE
jgi:hypothetical protein